MASMSQAHREEWSRARYRGPAILTLLLLFLIVSALIAVSSGRYPLSFADLFHFFATLAGSPGMAPARYDLLHNLIVEIRLPRVLGAILLGAALSASGAAFQGVFRNPLVSPNLLGVLSGAAFGAAAGMILGGDWLTVQIGAFACGALAVIFSLVVANGFGPGSLIMLVLGGIVSGGLFTALLSIAKFVADPYNQLPAIVVWLMGSLSAIDLHAVALASGPMVIALLVLSGTGRWLDALSMGDDEARTLGVSVAAVRLGVIGCATFLCALTVSLAGIIGWVGLIVPHIVRLVTGPRHGLLIPASALLGGSFLLWADLAARNIMGSEVPIGIVTELLGIPVFLVLLRRVRRGWS